MRQRGGRSRNLGRGLPLLRIYLLNLLPWGFGEELEKKGGLEEG
jgi:hypothetical protein